MFPSDLFVTKAKKKFEACLKIKGRKHPEDPGDCISFYLVLCKRFNMAAGVSNDRFLNMELPITRSGCSAGVNSALIYTYSVINVFFFPSEIRAILDR